MAWVALAGAALSAVGEEKSATAQAHVLNSQADDVYARGTREAAESLREGDQVMSDARAAIAASGGTTTDSGSQTLLGRIGREAQYNAFSRLYDAGSNARNLRMGATNVREAGKTRAIATIMSGAGQAYGSYSGGKAGGGYKSPYGATGGDAYAIGGQYGPLLQP